MTSEKFNEVIKSNDIVLGFIQKNNKDNWYSIEVTFEYKPVIKDNCISLEIKITTIRI